MNIRPHKESIQILSEIQAKDAWIIDGYGPLDILEARLEASDQIIFIDLPLWRHYWWCTKRQIKNAFSKRAELPEGCNEFTLKHTLKLFRTLFKVHKQMRPELLRILGRDRLKRKVFFVRTMHEWNQVFSGRIERDPD